MQCGRSAFHNVVFFGFKESVPLLLERGADIEAKDRVTSTYSTFIIIMTDSYLLTFFCTFVLFSTIIGWADAASLSCS
jgi:hypothetical protein